MIIASIALFVLAAALGLGVAVPLLKKKETNKKVAVAHGLFGAAGLIVLILYAARNPSALLTTGIIVFVVAAVGGAILFANDLRKKPGPIPLVVIHALAAVVALVLTLVAVFA